MLTEKDKNLLLDCLKFQALDIYDLQMRIQSNQVTRVLCVLDQKGISYNNNNGKVQNFEDKVHIEL